MTIQQIITFLQEQFPENLQEGFDNSGIQVFSDDALTGIFLSLDINLATIYRAEDVGCNLICTHHPLIFRPLKKIHASHYKEGIVYQLIKKNISLYSLHTNLDKVYCMKTAELLGLTQISVLFPHNDDISIGIGSRGLLPKPLSLPDLLSKAASAFKTDYLLYTGNRQKEIHSIAVLNGSGGSEVFALLGLFDCIITGDITYHGAFDASMTDTVVIDAGHFWTERFFMEHLKEELFNYLTNSGADTAIHIDTTEKNPLQLYVAGGGDG